MIVPVCHEIYVILMQKYKVDKYGEIASITREARLLWLLSL